MVVSWNWLREYVALDMSVEELEARLTMSGLNHEGTEPVGDDLAIDLEVTSNRPDCLGHIGVAREVAALWNQQLTIPVATPAESSESVDQLTRVAIECPELCRCYTARVIRGVKIGPSPAWLADRLRTLGIAVINNVVDVSNYVMMECGQPLHTFDFARLEGRRIIVREAMAGETFEAIDHKTYKLEPGMCVIADASNPVALGGVMGGAESEVSGGTTEVLIEAADFDPLSIRNTARTLNLHSPSSYRFERGVDRADIDWASRRCAELILEVAGGELATGMVVAGESSVPREPIVLRLGQLKRVLGIDVAPDEARQILRRLGLDERQADDGRVEVLPPSWRRDLQREIDLVEEVARIHGYDQIPEDVGVPMSPSARSRDDQVIERVRGVLRAAGFDEAMTLSATDEAWSGAFSPWSDAEPLQCSTAVLRRADRLRRSLVPSLLGARRTNETLSNQVIELFEIAKVYLPQSGELPTEEMMLAVTSGRGFLVVKGVIEAVVRAVHANATLEAVETHHELLDGRKSCELRLGGEKFGFLGEVSEAGRELFELRGATAVAEVRLSTLIAAADLIPQYVELSPYPAVTRDLSIDFDERVRWAEIEQVVRDCGDELLESVVYQDTYRDDQRVGKDKKNVLFGMSLRSATGTLTREEADAVCEKVVGQLEESLGGRLRT